MMAGDSRGGAESAGRHFCRSPPISESKIIVSVMPRVIHFEIPVDDPERAVRFYAGVFGWRLERWEPFDYWLAYTGEGPGIDGALKPREEAGEGTTNTVEVPDLEEAMAKVAGSGGEVLSEIMTVPGVGRFARCRGPGG